ncbi:DUF5687 family protein [Hufsiella ginkgonis]|uniref:Uncharacterized protein n=1 Tax=Hufsiella ginkgonis TaxID=2695274 RepID=A0A7K1XV16_9SPHI|nr:DUF5687 family protein [Hufsiella ginkgonis]MXV14638.1 hypothetical protein [Hufsiella ginkgonis]
MTTQFLDHQWKSFWRSKNTGKSIAIRVVLWLLILYFVAIFLVLSFAMDKILGKVFPGQDVIASFNGFILYYFLLDLVMRFQLQELPTLSVQPYLILPIRKKQIVNYLSLSSLSTTFNYSPFILSLPFLLKVVLPQKGGLAFTGILLSLLGLTLFNHFFSLYIKRKVNLNGWVMLLFLGAIGLVSYLDFKWHVISIAAASSWLFNSIITAPALALAVLAFAVGCFYVNYLFLKSNLYLDELRASSSAVKSSTEIPFLDRFGAVGDLVANEVKLILRNKRPKSTLTMSFIFLLYGLIFYTKPQTSTIYWAPIFCGTFITGIFIINYGQFMFSWQSSHFDGILVSKVRIRDFFAAKFLMFTIASTVAYILSTPYTYFGWHILYAHTAMYLWNMGVSSFIVLWFATYNYKKINLSKGASFNWEGVGASQFLLSIPLFVTPLLIFLPFNLLHQQTLGLVVLGLIGMVFLLTRKTWIDLLTKRFNKQRYKIAEGFRNE